MTIPRTPETIGSLGADVQTFALALRAEGKAAKTVRTYCEAACWLAQRLSLRRDNWSEVTRKDIRQHLAWMSEHYSPSYCSNQHRALAQFFKWIAEEDGFANPMAGMRPPHVPQRLVPVVGDDELARLLATCDKSFNGVRDRAIITLFASSGARLAEVAGLRVSDLDLPLSSAIVTGKAGRQRIIRFSPECAVALSRYLKVRSGNIYGVSDIRKTDMLWVGQRGPLHGNAVYLMVKRRAKRAGVHIHPHQFRHTYAHHWLVNGGNEGDLMQLAGWNSPSMVSRYGASAAAERARSAYDRVMAG